MKLFLNFSYEAAECGSAVGCELVDAGVGQDADEGFSDLGF